ncbi:MAG TPA: peptide deformylase [bacterium]|nr:peptide deformylase [bacterium]
MPIIRYGNALLRKKSKKISVMDQESKELGEKLIRVMLQHNGLGLAAVQIGIPKRMIAVNAELVQKDAGIIVLGDPEIIEQKGTSSEEEGCLSVPGIYEKVKRAEEVLVEGINIDGMKVRIRSKGYIARAFQHEIDHLNGILFLDRLSFIKKIGASVKLVKERTARKTR